MKKLNKDNEYMQNEDRLMEIPFDYEVGCEWESWGRNSGTGKLIDGSIKFNVIDFDTGWNDIKDIEDWWSEGGIIFEINGHEIDYESLMKIEEYVNIDFKTGYLEINTDNFDFSDLIQWTIRNSNGLINKENALKQLLFDVQYQYDENRRDCYNIEDVFSLMKWIFDLASVGDCYKSMDFVDETFRYERDYIMEKYATEQEPTHKSVETLNRWSKMFNLKNIDIEDLTNENNIIEVLNNINFIEEPNLLKVFNNGNVTSMNDYVFCDENMECKPIRECFIISKDIHNKLMKLNIPLFETTEGVHFIGLPNIEDYDLPLSKQNYELWN